MKLIKIDLELEERVGLASYLDQKLVLEVLGDLWVRKSTHVMHSLQQHDVCLVAVSEVCLGLIEESFRFCLHVLAQHHVQKKTHKDRKHDSLELVLELVKGAIYEVLELVEGIKELCGLD